MRPYYYLGGKRGLTRLASGQLFIVNTEARDIATSIIYMGGWETFVDDVLSALARPGDTFLDIGSNMGYYAIKVGGLVGPSGRLFAYEPNPALFEVLHDNVRINGFSPRATLFQAAAGEEAGASSLTFEPRFPGGGTAGLGPEYAVQGRVQIDIDVVKVDETVEGEAHLIKIDVEGFEPLVLRGMRDLLARSPEAALVVEVSYSQWARFGDPVQMVNDLAEVRRIFRIRTDGKLEEIDKDQIDQSLHRHFPSYILFLPRSAERWEQIKRFVTTERRPYDVHSLVEPPPPPVSLLRRVIDRVARSVSFRLANALRAK